MTSQLGIVIRLGRRLPLPIRRPLRAAYLALHRLAGGRARVQRRAGVLRTYGALTPSLPALRYLLAGKETENFTYDISNIDELAAFVADAVGVGQERALAWIQELETDGELRRRLEHRLKGRRAREPRARYGRRLGWYAVARAVKPRLLVETGVHDGLGTAVLLRALERNAEEGADGRLLSLDIRPDVGWLVDDSLRVRLDLRIGDAKLLLPQALGDRTVDMFIHDSDHSYEHESFELETVAAVARPGAVLISDNAHAGHAFADFCSRHGLTADFFRERPIDHFYPGAGIGLTRWRESE